MLPLVRDAIADERQLAFEYYSASSDRVSERRVDPVRVIATEGHWYLDAWCDTASDLRRFRVDRIRSAEPVDLPGLVRDREEQGGDIDVDAFVPGPDSDKVLLSLDPGVAWQVESVPTASEPRGVDGRAEVEVFVGGAAWLERLLLGLGADARVVAPAEYRRMAADAARRILRRYETGPYSSPSTAGMGEEVIPSRGGGRGA